MSLLSRIGPDEKKVNDVNDALIDLRNAANKTEIPKNKTADKVIDIVEEILNLNKQQKGKWLKILTPKQMLQRLPMALAQV